MPKRSFQNGFAPILAVLIIAIFGVVVYAGYKSGGFSRVLSLFTSSKKTIKAFCKENYCFNYNDSQIKIGEWGSKDVEILSFDKLGESRYFNEVSLMSLRVVSSKNKDVDEYIRDNQKYCDDVVKTAEETGGPTDCHRFTKISQKIVSGNIFTEVHESGGGGSPSSLDLLIMNNGKVYEFSCNASNQEEFNLLESYDFQKVSLFEKSKSFETCINLINGFSFTK